MNSNVSKMIIVLLFMTLSPGAFSVIFVEKQNSNPEDRDISLDEVTLSSSRSVNEGTDIKEYTSGTFNVSLLNWKDSDNDPYKMWTISLEISNELDENDYDIKDLDFTAYKTSYTTVSDISVEISAIRWFRKLFEDGFGDIIGLHVGSVNASKAKDVGDVKLIATGKMGWGVSVFYYDPGGDFYLTRHNTNFNLKLQGEYDMFYAYAEKNYDGMNDNIQSAFIDPFSDTDSNLYRATSTNLGVGFKINENYSCAYIQSDRNISRRAHPFKDYEARSTNSQLHTFQCQYNK